MCCLKVCTCAAGIDELIRHKDTERLCSFYVDLLPELARIQVMSLAVRGELNPGGLGKGGPCRGSICTGGDVCPESCLRL